MANPLEEIQERLADFENRISFLENSLPGSAMTPKEEETKEIEIKSQEPWNKKQWDIVNQLRGEVARWRNALIEHLTKTKQGDRL